MENYHFGRQLQALFPPPFDSNHLAIERLDRTSTNGWKVQIHPDALKFIPNREIPIGDAGMWLPQLMKTPSTTSVVVYGVPEEIGEEHVARFLVQGSSHLVRPEDRERLTSLRVTRLRSRRREEPEPAGARTVGTSTAAESSPTRSCRVFLPPDLAHYFGTTGEMMLRWKRLRCKPYEPRRFWCQKCRGWGSHSTQFHRQLAGQSSSIAPDRSTQT